MLYWCFGTWSPRKVVQIRYILPTQLSLMETTGCCPVLSHIQERWLATSVGTWYDSKQYWRRLLGCPHTTWLKGIDVTFSLPTLDPLSLEEGQWSCALVMYCQHGNAPSWGMVLKNKKMLALYLPKWHGFFFCRVVIEGLFGLLYQTYVFFNVMLCKTFACWNPVVSCQCLFLHLLAFGIYTVCY